jgi:hypothetical protein
VGLAVCADNPKLTNKKIGIELTIDEMFEEVLRMTIPEDANIECPHQRVSMGYLTCRAADTSRGKDATDEVTEEICYKCEAGRIFREVGCDQFWPKTRILAIRTGRDQLFRSGIQRIFCNRRKRETTYEYCKTCTLVTSPETEKVYKEALTLFESSGFDTTKSILENARKELTANGNPEGCITSSVSSLESTLKLILDKLGKPYPKKEQLTELWSSVKAELKLGDEISTPLIQQVMGSLTGVVSGLAGIRNALSDAHGKGEISPDVFESYAELSMNLSASISTFLIRRFKEISKP